MISLTIIVNCNVQVNILSLEKNSAKLGVNYFVRLKSKCLPENGQAMEQYFYQLIYITYSNSS